MRYEIQSQIVLRILNEDGTRGEIVGISRTESFEGTPKEFKQHFEVVGYEIDRRVEEEFDKQFPNKPTQKTPLPPTKDDDEIPF